jgi:hypothetical protein
MDQAAVFLAGSILTALGFIVFVIAVVIINNILHKYWKPVSLFTPDSWKGFNPPILDKDVNESTNTGVK